MAAALVAAACLGSAAAESAAPLPLIAQEGAVVVVLDPVSLAPRARWSASRPLLGPPQVAPDGRSAFAATEGGLLFKLQLDPLASIAQARAEGEVTAFALSADGGWLLAATAAGALELFDASLRRQQRWRAASLDGTRTSAVAQVRDDPARRCFLVTFERLPELWQISYDPAAEPIFDGLVHDYRMGEAIARGGFLGVRRAPLEAPLRLLAVGGGGRHALGVTATGTGAALDLVHLDVRRRIARTELGGAAVVDAALFERAGRELLAVADSAGRLRIVDPAAGHVVQELSMGPIASVRAHPAAPQLWVGLQEGPARIALVDRQALRVEAVLPLPGELRAAPAFTPAGDRVLVSVREAGADALLVFDARQPGAPHRVRTEAAPQPAPRSP